ncbi:MAG TPA: AAA family ATPase [Candidatus Thiothrix moscowensis]|uniref:AAA family ATPase n=1 Tax=unclassified Thiothrix TaxID=2636184 RepID=UPI0025F78895|nr:MULTISPECIES: AAA family ATPase [unclassified Thiothrix]HRJ51783.1 AAA family ATPase [Candidatus Thiothrix moscowensis]HRJ92098.1 AAA family ATPase [Candidatus Thiothrix moscowensis]
MLTVDKALIHQRKTSLENAKLALKQHFIGIDKIIDDLIDYIQVWYLMPELLKRPVIVNLWGMTGVGKTDLVRKLVKHLHFQDRFVEIELSNVDQTSWNSSVSSVLESYEFHDGKPCIVLFDEIQRFNTLDELGKPMPQTKFMDFWELLSDGHLSKKQRDDLDSFLFSYYQRRQEAQRKRQAGEEVSDSVYYLSSWEAISLKKALNLHMDMEELLSLSEDDMIDLIMQAKRQKTIYEPIDHAKTLILISGNLDDAFQMATQAAESEVDADIFHAFTTKVTLMDVKGALMRKFRPEQVARFGNIHLIYPSLRKQDFTRLIEREIERVQQETVERTGIRLAVDHSMVSLIYRNGVFPVQGVRPVFSSVTDILEVNLSKLLFHALTHDAEHIALRYASDAKQIEAQVGDEKVYYPYVGRIDDIRASNEQATVANISIHEAGHAVVYMALFGLAPLQLKSRIANAYAGGFTFPHQIHRTHRTMLDMIKVYLAGGIAEELVFGAPNATTGREYDREQATMLALDYVRRFGFDAEFQACYILEDHAYKMHQAVTDIDAEKMMMRLASETRELLAQHRQLLLALGDALAQSGSLETQTVAELAARHHVVAVVKEEGYLHVAPYDQLLQQALPNLTN